MIWNDRIRNLRKESGFTLKEVAKKLNVSEATAQRYEDRENGIKNIPYDIIDKYATIFNVSPSYIMGWDKEGSGDSEVNDMPPEIPGILTIADQRELDDLYMQLDADDRAEVRGFIRGLLHADKYKKGAAQEVS